MSMISWDSAAPESARLVSSASMRAAALLRQGSPQLGHPVPQARAPRALGLAARVVCLPSAWRLLCVSVCALYV
jgi:hypothetical protein